MIPWESCSGVRVDPVAGVRVVGTWRADFSNGERSP
jgi:hypothetical protein